MEIRIIKTNINSSTSFQLNCSKTDNKCKIRMHCNIVSFKNAFWGATLFYQGSTRILIYLFYLHNKVMNDEAARARRVGSKVCNLSREYFAREGWREGEFTLVICIAC